MIKIFCYCYLTVAKKQKKLTVNFTASHFMTSLLLTWVRQGGLNTAGNLGWMWSTRPRHYLFYYNYWYWLLPCVPLIRIIILIYENVGCKQCCLLAWFFVFFSHTVWFLASSSYFYHTCKNWVFVCFMIYYSFSTFIDLDHFCWSTFVGLNGRRRLWAV